MSARPADNRRSRKIRLLLRHWEQSLPEDFTVLTHGQLKLLGLAGVLLFMVVTSAQAAGNIYATERGKISFLGALLCGLILLIYAVNFLVRLIAGYVQHRRACRIAAVLETEGHEFAGFLSIIGLNGCRFQPMNKTVEGRLLKLLQGRTFYDYDIKIAGKTYPVFVDGFHGFFSALYFYDHISREELSQILTLSKIKPYLVPRIGHETTRKVWRANIERRKEKIAALKAAQKLKDQETALHRQMNGAGSHHGMV
jgi:hypothetical protein